MINKIENYLFANKYKKVQTNAREISFYLSPTAVGRANAIVCINDTLGSHITHDSLVNLSEKFRTFLKQKGYTYVTFLYILITDDDNLSRVLFKDYTNFWRIVPSKGILMTFEGGDSSFNYMIKPLENIISSAVYGHSSYRNSQSYTSNSGQSSYSHGPQSYGPGPQSYGPGPQSNGPAHNPNLFSQLFSSTESDATDHPPYVTIGLIIINTFVFLIMFIFNLSDYFTYYGGLSYYPVLHNGDFYRLLTSIFIHSGFSHLFNNMLVLLFSGMYVERFLGHVKFTILYFLSGILAGCSSMVYNMLSGNIILSIGASGAIFGVTGAFVYLIWHKHHYNKEIDMRRIFIMLFFMLYGGFTSQGVDNAAHVGGLIFGVIITAILNLKIFKSQ